MFLGVVVLVTHDNNISMPFLDLAKNLSNIFFIFYLVAILFALFSSLLSSLNNIKTLTNCNTKLSLILILIFCQIIAFLGFDFIVKYLYTFSGLLGVVYCLIIMVRIFILNRKNNNKKSCSKNSVNNSKNTFKDNNMNQDMNNKNDNAN